MGKAPAEELAPRMTASRLANVGANAIFAAYTEYDRLFRALTRRARWRFESRDWHGMQDDSRARLDLYRQSIDSVVEEIRVLLGERVQDQIIWTSMKAVYSGLIAPCDTWELAETFFNSATRRIFRHGRRRSRHRVRRYRL